MKLTTLAIAAALSFTSAVSATEMQKEMFSGKSMQNGYAVEIIEQCGVASQAGAQDFVLFGGDTNRLSGWSHAGRIAGLRLADTEYRSEVVAATTCNNVPVYQNILVKKYADWDAQHVNGVEPNFSRDNITLSQLESIVLEFKVSSTKSHIPTKMDISALYSPFLNTEQLSALDNHKINFGITIFEAGFNNQSTASFNASIIVELDQAKYFDQWVKVTIPASSLYYFTQKNWAETSINPEDFAGTKIVGLRINPETQSGNVVRHAIMDTFQMNTPPEAYKEMNVAFKKVALVLK